MTHKIIILGLHCSGFSVVSNLLEKILTPFRVNNSHQKFNDHKKIITINDALLRSTNSNVDGLCYFDMTDISETYQNSLKNDVNSYLMEIQQIDFCTICDPRISLLFSFFGVDIKSTVSPVTRP